MTQISATDIDRLWLIALQDVINRSAHELKDALNGVSLNLEVIRSRTERGDKSTANGIGSFAEAAVDQLEHVASRAEAVLFLARPPKKPADVAVALKHLAVLLVPTAKANGGALSVEGYDVSVPTSAGAQATRLGLAAGLLALIKEGGSGRCKLSSGRETVVRFSHEAAHTCSIEPEIASAVSESNIRIDRSGNDLLLVFPGH